MGVVNSYFDRSLRVTATQCVSGDLELWPCWVESVLDHLMEEQTMKRGQSLLHYTTIIISTEGIYTCESELSVPTILFTQH